MRLFKFLFLLVVTFHLICWFGSRFSLELFNKNIKIRFCIEQHYYCAVMIDFIFQICILLQHYLHQDRVWWQNAFILKKPFLLDFTIFYLNIY